TNATGLIFYPGARVDPRAYAPHARSIAAEGFRVVIVPMPLNLAFLGIGRASRVVEANPEIEHWAVGGHSLGGAMAAEFVNNNPGMVKGLVFWAAYPAENTNLSSFDLEVMSIYATNDGLATPDEVLSARSRLPVDAEFVEIHGGNHAGFGWYGQQRGDGKLDITKTDQQSRIVAATVSFLTRLAEE
ncbi:MAG: alpha/beta hydrolase, partial [Brevefilum sp.]